MPHIVVDDLQAKLIRESEERIEVRDQNGQRLGYLDRGFSDEDIAVAKERLASDEPRFTTQQVLDHIQSLESPANRPRLDVSALRQCRDRV